MLSPDPASLDSAALSRRLGELAGHERVLQVDFLLHLEEFDRRRAWAEEGYGSLWDYMLRVLHLREGAAGRRIAAMRVLRRLPVLADALRDGRLSLSTVALLGPVLTEDNVEDLVARAAFRTKAEVELLVASVAPRNAPKEGLRRLPARSEAPRAAASVPSACAPLLIPSPCLRGEGPAPAEPVAVAAPPAPPPARPTVRPVDADTYSLRVTVDAAFKAELDELRALLSHKVPSGDLAAVLREAVRCAREKYGKRKGAVAPARKVPAPKPIMAAGHSIPAEVRREVWRRDGGQCAWRAPDGRRCESRWRLELDHVVPVALGGESTVGNVRLTCRQHNLLHAEHVFGREHMEQFRGTRTGENATPGDSSGRGNGAP